jgi:hypothetical protein
MTSTALIDRPAGPAGPAGPTGPTGPPKLSPGQLRAAQEAILNALLRHRLAPWLIAFGYYHVSWLMFVIRPEWSYRP